MMKPILLICLVIAIFITYQVIRTRRYIAIGVELANAAIPYEQEGEGKRILIIGDSTAVGTGAHESAGSIAGLVGKKYPNAMIKNLGVNGAITKELIPRLEAEEGHYDLLMIHIGGNDTRKFIDVQEVDTNLREILTLAKKKSDAITLTSTGNMGTAKLLPFGVRWLYERQTRKVREVFLQVASDFDVPYSDIFREPANDPFAQEPQTYYSADWFHPSSEGYKDWFVFIEDSIDKAVKNQ